MCYHPTWWESWGLDFYILGSEGGMFCIHLCLLGKGSLVNALNLFPIQRWTLSNGVWGSQDVHA